MDEVETPKKKKKNFKIIITMIIAIVIVIGIYFIFFNNKNIEKPLTIINTQNLIYNFSGNKFSYSQDRGYIDYKMTQQSDNNTFTIYNISFYSRDFLNFSTKIYGLLLMPKNKTNVPGIVYLPGGGVSKEKVLTVTSLMAREGYAVLIIDQRGIGETGGYYLSFEDDYAVFSQGKEPIQHLSVYDVLATSDVLREMNNVDKDNIAIAGESMGARYAIIAAAIDKRFKGVLGISVSGFNIVDDHSNEAKYLLSIDPDNYIADISPNYVIMMHGGNDTTVPLNESKNTYGKALEPKKFYFYKKCRHGYCPDMDNDIKSSLKLILNKS